MMERTAPKTPIFRKVSPGPVGGSVGCVVGVVVAVGVSVGTPPMPPETVTVCVHALLIPPALSVKIAEAVKVPSVL